MNWHPTEDELILHYYGEAPNEIRSVTEEHLAHCSSCAAAWRELTVILGAVTAVPVPEPDEGFERVMWARVSRALPPRRTRLAARPVCRRRRPGGRARRGHRRHHGVDHAAHDERLQRRRADRYRGRLAHSQCDQHELHLRQVLGQCGQENLLGV